MHIHRREDELFHVIEGTFEVTVGDRRVQLNRGDLAVGPRGIAHSYRNIGKERGRLLVVLIPAGFECFFREVHNGGQELRNTESMAEMAARYGLEFVSPEEPK